MLATFGIVYTFSKPSTMLITFYKVAIHK